MSGTIPGLYRDYTGTIPGLYRDYTQEPPAWLAVFCREKD